MRHAQARRHGLECEGVLRRLLGGAGLPVVADEIQAIKTPEDAALALCLDFDLARAPRALLPLIANKCAKLFQVMFADPFDESLHGPMPTRSCRAGKHLEANRAPASAGERVLAHIKRPPRDVRGVAKVQGGTLPARGSVTRRRKGGDTTAASTTM